MRKIVLFVLVMIFGLCTVSAQEIDSLQSENLSARIDSLTLELKQLRHDYDFFYCKYLVETCTYDIARLCTDIRFASERITSNSYHGTWNVDAYIHYKDGIGRYEELLNLNKQDFENRKFLIDSVISRANFTDSEKEYLQSMCSSFEARCILAEGCIREYKLSVELYKLSR